MLSAPKFIQSDSTSGPSAIVQPMAPKIAAISSMVRLIGWIRPVSRGRGGSVGSRRSAARRASSSAFSSAAAAGLDQGGQRVLEPVQRGAALAALLGRGLAEVAQQGGEAAVAAERGDADRVPGAQVGGGGERGLGFALQVGEIVGHGGSLHYRSSVMAGLDPAIARPCAVRTTWMAGLKPGHGRGSQSAACTFLTISANDAASS